VVLVELLPSAGRPANVVVAGVEGDKFGSTVCATQGVGRIDSSCL
jgi:hypothetical protein